MKSRYGPNIGEAQGERLEVAGMTPQQIDDAVSALRVRSPEGFTMRDVLEYHLGQKRPANRKRRERRPQE